MRALASAAGHPFATQSHAYGYDEIDRLLTATATTPGNDTYGYDPVDNATTVTTPSLSVNPTYNHLNEMATFGAKNYSYDANGNTLTGDGIHSYQWDAENRLIEIDYTSGNKSQFTYDGMGHRTVEVETPQSGGAVTTHYLWCGDRICQTRDGNDNVLRRDLDEGEYNVTTGQQLIYMPDQLGSARDVLDGTTGTLVDAFDYSPYGAITQSYGTAQLDFRFAGLVYHPSGLNLATYRQIDPVTGRWLNRDPLREFGGVNLYMYSGANPINWSDPLGLCWIYSQSTGLISYEDEETGSTTPVGTGYSGYGAGLNNPAMQSVAGHHPNPSGPIPQGKYTMGPEQTNVTGAGVRLPASIRLTPASTNQMFGRAGFLIHGPHPNDKQDSSEGCPIFKKSIRDLIGNGEDDCLEVAP